MPTSAHNHPTLWQPAVRIPVQLATFTLIVTVAATASYLLILAACVIATDHP